MSAKKSKTIPYRLLCMLLYGNHNWLARTGYVVTAPTARLASTLRTRSGRLREYVYDLENWGLIVSAKFNPNWVQVQLRVPKGMQWGADLGSKLNTEVIDV